MLKAYSYLRFSTPEQGKGDSFRRQIELARNYASMNELDLDQDLQFHDYGISAFHGRNAKIGALRQFLDQVEYGNVQRGSYLLVESLDRLTRDEVITAMGIFLQIIQGGITLVTLMDGKKYSKESVNSNPADMLLSLTIMMRAREESETKSKRMKANWANKRNELEAGQIYHRTVPSWLKFNKSEQRIEIIEERAKVVKLIFKLANTGLGAARITKYLNSKNIPTFYDLEYWDSHQISRITKNEAVTGVLNLCIRKIICDGNSKVPIRKIKNYYPRIISPSAFNEVQKQIKSRQPMRRPHSRPGGNIFCCLAKCSECGSSMVMSWSNRSYKYILCNKYANGAGCNSSNRVRCDHLESALVQNISFIISSAPKFDMGNIVEKLKEIVHEIKSRNDEIRRLKGSTNTLKPSHFDKVMELERKLNKLLKSQNELMLQKASLNDASVTSKLNHLSNALSVHPLNLRNINNILLQLFKDIVINCKTGQICLNWKQGGETIFTY